MAWAQGTVSPASFSANLKCKSANDTKVILPNEDRPRHGPQVAEAGGELLPALWVTGRDGLVLQVLGAGLSRLGWRNDWAIGKSLTEIFSAEGQDCPAVAAHRRALAGQATTFELARGGRTFFGKTRPLYGEDGALAGTLSVAYDISQLELLQEESRRLESWLQKVTGNNSLRTFAGGLAHRLNNLLTAVVGNASLIREKLPVESPFQDPLAQIETVGHAIADMAGQMLLYAQKGRLFLEPLNLARLIEELDGHFKASVSDKVAVKCDLSSDLPDVLADPAQISRLVNSLFFNAAEAIGDKSGVIVLRTQAIVANRGFLATTGSERELPEGRYVWLQVSDTGCGIDAETGKHIFEPFFSTKFIGRGLGLSAVAGIVCQHQGAIWYSSKPGRGSTFHVLLPCARTA